MIPATYNIELYRGDDFTLVFRMRDSVTGDYINLAGRTGLGQIRASAEDATVLATFTVAVLDQTTTPGAVSISLSPTQTAALPLSGGVYDIEVASADRSWVRTPIAGKVTVIAEVTR